MVQPGNCPMVSVCMSAGRSGIIWIIVSKTCRTCVLVGWHSCRKKKSNSWLSRSGHLDVWSWPQKCAQTSPKRHIVTDMDFGVEEYWGPGWDCRNIPRTTRPSWPSAELHSSSCLLLASRHVPEPEPAHRHHYSKEANHKQPNIFACAAPCPQATG